MALSASLSFDKRLAPDDIAASRAHVRGLARGGIISGEEAATLAAALDRVSEELGSGEFVFKPGDEDIHTAIERRVTELAPEVGARLHTGRSRNDQVATDMRLFFKEACRSLGAKIMQDVTEVMGMGWLSILIDPTGAVLGLWQTKM